MKRAALSNTHTIPRAGARSLGNSTTSEPRGQWSPPSGGAGSGEPLRWAGPRISCLSQVWSDGGSGWPRRAPRSSPTVAFTASWLRPDAGDSRSAGSLSGLAPPGYCGAPKAGCVHGQLQGRSLPHFFFPGLSNSAPGLRWVCYCPMQRDPSGAARAGQLASLTSLRSGTNISVKYRPERTIRCAGTGEEQRLSVSVSDAPAGSWSLKGTWL